MKNLFLMGLIVITQISFAQTTKNTGEFNSINVFDRISVELIPSSENKIEIEGNRADEVEIVNKNGALKIRMALSKLLDGEEVTAKLYFKNLEAIDASEGSYVVSDAIFKQTSLAITAKEGAEISLVLDVKKARIKAVTGAKIKLAGSASNQEVAIGTGGILEAETLKTTQTTVIITTGGEADVRASEFVDAKVRAGGTITIYGSPKQINQKTMLGGTIEESKR